MTSTTSPSDTIRLKSRLSVRSLRPRPVDERIVDLTDLMEEAETRSAFADLRILPNPAQAPVALNPNVVRAARRGPVALFVVRLFDILVAVVGLVVLTPLMLVVALAVIIDSPGPVFYGSPRLGSRGTTFRAWKFRSMHPEADRELATVLADDATACDEYERFHKLRNDPRLTRVGAIIRQVSLDELPQLVNILIGQMSVVGPRPKLSRDAESYGHHLETVLKVRPGLTGLWQVSGRNRLPMAERVELDLRYLEERSLRGDLMICARTFIQLWRPRKHGAY